MNIHFRASETAGEITAAADMLEEIFREGTISKTESMNRLYVVIHMLRHTARYLDESIDANEANKPPAD